MSVADGTFVVAIGVDEQGPQFNYGSLNATSSLATRGPMGLEVVSPPPDLTLSQLMLQLEDEADNAAFVEIVDTSLMATQFDAGSSQYITLASTPYDHIAQRWIRIRFDRTAGTFGVDTSPDGIVWSPLLEPQTISPLDFATASLRVIAGSTYRPLSGVFTTADNLLVCAQSPATFERRVGQSSGACCGIAGR